MYIATIYFLILIQTNLAHQKPKIIGGSPCKLHKTRFMVALTRFDGKHMCGGSLIHPYWVLSASHCATHEFTLYASDVFTRAKYVDEKGVLSEWTPVIEVIEIIMHPEYDDFNLKNDIGLMKLKRQMPLEKVQMVKLPTSKVSAELPEFCPTAAVMGYGEINRHEQEFPVHLQCIELKTITHAECVYAYRTERSKVFNTTMCTGINEEEGVCYGDSGSPLMCGRVNYGIVSWSVGCASKWPTVYTRVDYYLRFIHEHVYPSQRNATEGLYYSKLFLITFVLLNKIFSYI